MSRTLISCVCIGSNASVTSKAAGIKPSAQKPMKMPSSHT